MASLSARCPEMLALESELKKLMEILGAEAVTLDKWLRAAGRGERLSHGFGVLEQGSGRIDLDSSRRR